MKRLVLTLLLFGAFSGYARPEEAWVYMLDDGSGSRACLIAVAHLSPHPIQHSKRVEDCLSKAPVVAFETDPTERLASVWEGYVRQPSDPRLESLSRGMPEKVRAALAVGGYSPSEIKYLLNLHPAGVYRALLYGKAFASNVKLLPNIDLTTAARAKADGKPLISFEGMPAFYANEKNISVDQLGELIDLMCDLYLSPERMAKVAKELDLYAQTHSVLPEVDSSHKAKIKFNTEIMGLPLYSVAYDVDNRNAGIAEGIARTVHQHPHALIFIGADHLGGPQGVLGALERKGIANQRLDP